MILFESFTPADIIGSIGVSLLLLAFALNLAGWLTQEGVAYASINAVGAGLAGYASWLIAYWPFVVLESIWFLVSVVAIGRALRGRRRPETR